MLVKSIKAARANVGLSQEETAVKLGLSKGTYQRMENDIGEMRMKDARRLSELLGLESVDSLFFADDSISDEVHDDDKEED